VPTISITEQAVVLHKSYSTSEETWLHESKPVWWMGGAVSLAN